MVKRVIYMSIALAVLSAAHSWGQQLAIVQTTTEKVEMQRDSGWITVRPGDRMSIGTTISTGFGSTATLAIGPALMQVQPLTRMRLDELAERDGLTSAELFLQVGRVRAEVRSVEGLDSEFRLRSTQATAAVRGTSFDFDGRDLRVLSGTVQLTNQFQQATNVNGGESAEASATGELAFGSEIRERTAVVQVLVTALEDSLTTFLQRRDEMGTGVIRVQWVLQ
jgi:hypothetical protein